jgi:hypothetical protein
MIKRFVLLNGKIDARVLHLIGAMQEKDYYGVRMMIKEGVDINSTHYNTSVLQDVVQRNDVDGFDFLTTQLGVDVARCRSTIMKIAESHDDKTLYDLITKY